MKKIILSLVLALAAWPAMPQGIEVSQLPFAEGLEKARAENKMVFIDCYTEWCGPCKRLAAEIFPQPEVGKFFNANFVNLQIDMEKGEGVELAKRFKITAYPTMLMLDADGNVCHKVVGYVDGTSLIEHGNTAIDGKNSLATLAKAYEDGERNPDMVLAYIVALLAGSEEEKATEIATELFASLSDEQKTDPALWPIYSNKSVAKWGTPWFSFLAENTSSFNESVGRAKVDAAIYEVATDVFTDAIFYPREGVSLELLPRIVEQIGAMDFDRRDKVVADGEFTVALIEQDAPRTVELFEKYGKEFSNKGVMVFLPIMLQNGQSDPDNFPATKALIELLKKMSEEEAANA
jgi:thioredoxin-related protein